MFIVAIYFSIVTICVLNLVIVEYKLYKLSQNNNMNVLNSTENIHHYEIKKDVEEVEVSIEEDVVAVVEEDVVAVVEEDVVTVVEEDVVAVVEEDVVSVVEEDVVTVVEEDVVSVVEEDVVTVVEEDVVAVVEEDVVTVVEEDVVTVVEEEVVEISTCAIQPQNDLLRNATSQLECAIKDIKEYTRRIQQSGGEGTFATDECCICYEMIGTKNNCVTECGHSFCLTCIATSIRKNVLCPICRQNIIEDSDSDSDEGEEDSDGEEDDDSEEEDDEDDEYDDSDDEDNAFDFFKSSTERGSVTEIAKRCQDKGITYKDLISIYFHRGDASTINNQIELYAKIQNLYKTTCEIRDEVDNELLEQALFGKEDAIEITRSEVRDEITDMIDGICYEEEYFNEMREIDE